MNAKILCCGEALIDFVPLPAQRAYRPCPGGSVFNIAIGLGRLQIPVGFFCKLSEDDFGSLLADTLAENGVDTSLVLRAPGATTLAFVSLPDKTHSEPRFMFYASGAVERSLLPEELPNPLPEEIAALHFGSISLVLEPGASAYETLMRRESRRRILSLDPNVRPGIIPDRHAYRQRFESWVEMVDILRLSLADLEWLYPAADPAGLLRGWLGRGVALCILTRGAQGAEAYTADGAYASAEAQPVAVADTVGAGDSFLAACLAWLHDHAALSARHTLVSLPAEALQACLQFAARAAAINCSRPGADPPYRREML